MHILHHWGYLLLCASLPLWSWNLACLTQKDVENHGKPMDPENKMWGFPHGRVVWLSFHLGKSSSWNLSATRHRADYVAHVSWGRGHHWCSMKHGLEPRNMKHFVWTKLSPFHVETVSVRPKDKKIWQCVKTNSTPSVHIKIAGKWMFIPLKMVCIGIDP